jgi:hypothetical protein
MSRSIRNRSFSRQSREISAAGSGTEGAAEAGGGCGTNPACRPPPRLRQLPSIEDESPSSLAIRTSSRPLLASKPAASVLNSSVK